MNFQEHKFSKFFLCFFRKVFFAFFILVFFISCDYFVFAAATSSATSTVTIGNSPTLDTSIGGAFVSPGSSVVDANTFTLRVNQSTTTVQVSQVLVNLNSGTKNDAITWMTSVSAVDNVWTSVTYGNGLFVAVANSGTGNRVMTSSDGITWTSRTSAMDHAWSSVTYGNGLFVAVACGTASSSCNTNTGNRVMTSPDGVTWTARVDAVDNQWTSVTYGNGLFVAVANSGTGNRVMTSPDGITWTSRTSASDLSWSNVTYGNGMFVATSIGGSSNVMISTDGSSWSLRVLPAAADWSSITYGNGVFVALRTTGTSQRIMTSSDGLSWGMVSTPADNNWSSITYGNGLFVAVANSGTGNRVMVSPDGTTWTLRTSAVDNNWSSITYGNGVFVAVSSDGTGNRVMTSSSGASEQNKFGNNNGIMWATTTISSAIWKSVTYGNGLFVAVSNSGVTNSVATSPDGINWTLRSAPNTNAWNSVTYGNGMFVAVGYTGTGNRVMTSYDGITWTSRTSAADNMWTSVTYGSGLFVAVACGISSSACNATSGNRVMTSPNGITWTIRTTGSPMDVNSWQGVTYGDGTFVAVAQSGTSNRVMTSLDGSNWTSRTSAADNAWQSIIYGNGKFVAVACGVTTTACNATAGNRVMTSATGTSWSLQTTPADNQWTGLTYANGLFVATAMSGTGNRVMVSSDGSSWSTSSTTNFDNGWIGVTFGNGMFVSVAGTGTTTWAMVSNSGYYFNNPNDYQGISSVQITNSNGSTVYGSTTNPTSNIVSVPITSSTLTLSTAVTDYKVRIIPKTHANMPTAVTGDVYKITPTVVTLSASSTQTTVVEGADAPPLSLSIDNRSPSSTINDGASWSPATVPAGISGNTWKGIAYGSSTFVAISSTSSTQSIMTSYDGITWTLRNTPVTDSWFAITYGNGLFVMIAGGNSNKILTSPDGINWTQRTAPVSASWNSITYGNGVFVAVSSGGGIISSTDGINWKITTIWSGLGHVTFGNGLFVAVANYDMNNFYLTSSDGYSWSIRTMSGVADFNSSINYGNGQFILSRLGIYSSSTLVTSSDGVNWVGRIPSAAGYPYSVTYGAGLYVAVTQPDSNGNNILTSRDGAIWTSQKTTPNSTSTTWSKVIYAGGKFVALSSTGAVVTSTSPSPTVSTFGTTATVSYIPPLDTDLSAVLVFSSTTPITSISLVDGTNYSQGTIIGGATLSCLDTSVTPGYADACTISGLTNGTQYYYAVYSLDSRGNYSPHPSIPQVNYSQGTANVVTLDDGGDTTSTVTFGPSSFPYIIDKFTLRTDAGASSISQITVDLNAGARNDGTTWSARTSAVDNSWRSVTYGNGLFVAVSSDGTGNRVMTSPDGITWTSRTSAADNYWNSVAYGNGMFVAVAETGTGNRVMTSPDGITWTIRTSAADNAWLSVTYGNGLFVAVAYSGSGNRVMTSPDGITWTIRTSAANNQWNGVTYGNGLFVAVSATTTNQSVMTSTDGTTWTLRTATTTNNWTSVTYGNGLFVAVANSGTGNRVMTSPDGITWTSRTSAADSSWLSVTYGNGLFVAVAFGASTVMVSLDGITWTTKTIPTFSDWRGVAYGNGVFVSVSSSGVGNRVVSSDSGTDQETILGKNDGIVWATSTSAVDNTWRSITYGNGLFVAVAQYGTGNRVMTSPDGITWTTRASAADNNWNSVTYGNGLFVAVSITGTGNRIMTSPDGITWTSRTNPVENQWYSVTYGNGLFVAVSIDGTGNRVMTSPDGITWTSRTSAADNVWTSVIYGNGLFVAVACGVSSTTCNATAGNRVMTSPDGITWTIRTSATDNAWFSITYGNGLFVAVATNGTGNRVMTSPDGITWTIRTSAADNQWVSVTFGNGLFVAVANTGTGNRVMTSPDGITWTSQVSVIDNDWTSVAYGNGYFAVVSVTGTGNRVMTSNSGTYNRSLNPYQGVKQVEITDSTGSVSYGSVSNPSRNIVSVPVSNLVATASTTQYAIRITPKSAIAMPQAPGDTYVLKPKVRSLSSSVRTEGADAIGTNYVVDNTSTSEISQDIGTFKKMTTSETYFGAVAYGNNMFVAIGSNYPTVTATSSDGITWNTRYNSLLDGWTWRSMAYGNGLFVALSANGNGTGNHVATSPDGINWTIRTSPADNPWVQVVYGNGIFVAVSVINGAVMTSPDGINWTLRSVPSNSWNSVTYGNGLFVAVACGVTNCNDGVFGTNFVMTSPDGITWTSRISPNSNEWKSVTYGNGLFVAVANTGTGNRVMTSPDGITWTSRTGIPDLDWMSVAYGGKFVAMSSNYDFMSSVDGINWVLYPNASPANTPQSITYLKDKFIVANDQGTPEFPSGYFTSKVNATTTSNKVSLSFTSPSDSDISGILVLRSLYQSIDIPVEGVTYSAGSLIGNSTAVCVISAVASTTYTCNDTTVVNGNSYYYKIFTYDVNRNYSVGITPQTSSFSPGTQLIVGNGNLATGTITLAPGGAATTSDAFTLQTDTYPATVSTITVSFTDTTSSGLADLAASSTALIEITNDAGTIVYGSSTVNTATTTITISGLTATSISTQYRIRVTPKSHIDMSPVPGGTYSYTTYVSGITTASTQAYSYTDTGDKTIVTDNTSPNDIDTLGASWKYLPPVGQVDQTSWNAITFGNGLFVAVSGDSSGSRVITSPDGITWTPRTSPDNIQWISVTYGNGVFVAVGCGTACGDAGGANSIMTSPDGITWTQRASVIDKPWRSIAYGNGKFIAVSGQNCAPQCSMNSPDGITWSAGTLSEQVSSIAYGNGKFVSMGYFGALVSVDDSLWTKSLISSLNYGYITFGNGLFSVVNADSQRSISSIDGVTWTEGSIPTSTSPWYSISYGGGVFIATSGNWAGSTSTRLMSSVDGKSWTSRSAPDGIADQSWNSSAYSNGKYVIVGNSRNLLISSNPTASSSANQIAVTFTAPTDTDISKVLVLRATSTVTGVPVEGTGYATSTTLGNATVACSYAITASSTYTCTSTGLTNGTAYYFKIYTQDTTGNWSTGVDLPQNPVMPGSTTVTLGTGTDTPSVSLAPGGSATTSDTFTLKTSSGTDSITSVTVTLATTTSQALSLVEITNDAGGTVYGSVANPSSDVVTITTAALTANTTQTQYRVRITPKSHVNMPSVPGTTYYITSRVTSVQTTAAALIGDDLPTSTTTVVTVDNASPSAATTISGIVLENFGQNFITYRTSTSADLSQAIVLRSTVSSPDTPVEGVTYTNGNTIGASTVVCVASGISSSTLYSCTDSSVSRSTKYYYTVYIKDSSGNYSIAKQLSQHLLLMAPNGGSLIQEVETYNGGTTTVSGGGGGGGAGDTGTTTTGTTTTSTTTPGNGGGGGDVGINYNGSKYAYNTSNTSFWGRILSGNLSLGNLFSGLFLGFGGRSGYAAEGNVQAECTLSFLGFCFVR